MYINDSVYDAVRILVKISKEAQEKSQEVRHHIGSMGWLKEYCTVRASTSRRSGHTTSVLKLMSENDMHIGYLTKTVIMVKEFNRLYGDFTEDRGYLEFCETFNSCCGKSGYKMMGRKYSHLDAVVVDISCMLSKVQEGCIYDIVVGLQSGRDDPNDPFFLIFLQ